MGRAGFVDIKGKCRAFEHFKEIGEGKDKGKIGVVVSELVCRKGVWGYSPRMVAVSREQVRSFPSEIKA